MEKNFVQYSPSWHHQKELGVEIKTEKVKKVSKVKERLTKCCVH